LGGGKKKKERGYNFKKPEEKGGLFGGEDVAFGRNPSPENQKKQHREKEDIRALGYSLIKRGL